MAFVIAIIQDLIEVFATVVVIIDQV